MTMQNDEVNNQRLLSPTIPAQFIVDALHGAKHEGVNVTALLAQLNVDAAAIAVPGNRVSIDQYSQVLSALAHTMNDASLGFLTKSIPLNTLEVYCRGIVGARSFIEAVQFFNLVIALFTDELTITVEQQEDSYVIGLQHDEVKQLDYCLLQQTLMLGAVRLLSWLVGETLLPKQVSFTYAAKAHDDNLRYLFGDCVSFEQQQSFVVIEKQAMELPIVNSNQLMDSLLTDLTTLIFVTSTHNPFTRQVRKQLLLAKAERWLELADVAAQMNLSENALWRKLKAEGVTFSALRDDVKRDWALLLVEDAALSIEQVSDSLRFSEVSAFRKAFKKWTGQQVSSYRQRLLS